MPLISTTTHTAPTTVHSIPSSSATIIAQSYSSSLLVNRRQFGPGFGGLSFTFSPPNGFPTFWSAEWPAESSQASSSDQSDSSTTNTIDSASAGQITFPGTTISSSKGNTIPSSTLAGSITIIQPTIMQSSKKTTAVVVGSAVAGSVAALLAVGICIFFILRRRLHKHLQNIGETIIIPLNPDTTPITIAVARREKDALIDSHLGNPTAAAMTPEISASTQPPRKTRTTTSSHARHSPTSGPNVVARPQPGIIHHGHGHGHTVTEAANIANGVRSQIAVSHDSNEEMRVTIGRMMEYGQRPEAHIRPVEYRGVGGVEGGALASSVVPDAPPPTYESL
ncbi:hypothetical protein DFJ43DRAFT_1079745 [Lentinula guzmanii]|uniref:Uncharacterized protein n=1 Tax=Lentinula guzmanii TaxID=2804957 RepID=A0AA38MYV0_9AGAR|nr:hypothetical protein DFJ43DRAFT_1079745 [Lentinula guzmanii]